MRTFRLPTVLAALAVLLVLALPVDCPAKQGGKFGMAKGMGGGMGGQKRPPAPRPEESGQGESVASEEMLRAFSPMSADPDAMAARGFLATGLRPAYPAEAVCPTADSFFADATRGDGSRRSRQFYHGLHGGLDIPVPEGTPVRAVAAGAVVHKSMGGGIGGIGLVLQHAPEDTGLPLWVYTEYKHFREMPGLELGRRVAMGETLGEAGTSGTVGGHYGEAGHSHLHLDVTYAKGEGYTAGRMLIPEDGYWMDPMALFRGGPWESEAARDLPEADKRVAVPYMTPDGVAVPPGAKVVWPFACPPR